MNTSELRWPRRARWYESSVGAHLEYRSRCGRYIVRRVQIGSGERPYYQALTVSAGRREFVERKDFRKPRTAQAACARHARKFSLSLVNESLVHGRG